MLVHMWHVWSDATLNIIFVSAVYPDLSPIEHVLDELERRLQRRKNLPENRHRLAQMLQDEWKNVPKRRIQCVTGSMRRCCQALITAQGEYTRYRNQGFLSL